MIKIGAFVSTAGGILKSIDRAKALGIESLMFFATSPRSFQRRPILDKDAREFQKEFQKARFDSLWIHGSYLMNFGSVNPELVQKSKTVLVADLTDSARLGAKGVIFHIGSHGGRGFAAVKDQLVAIFREVLQKTPAASWLVFENAAGQGGAIGAKFEELGELVRELKNERVKVCLDSQHAFAAGYAIHQPSGLDQTLAELDSTVGLERLVAIHLNDSKVPFGSGRDRHENLGEGEIGEAGIRLLTHHPQLQGLPFLLEVPGFDGMGPDLPNVNRLRALAMMS